MKECFSLLVLGFVLFLGVGCDSNHSGDPPPITVSQVPPEQQQEIPTIPDSNDFDTKLAGEITPSFETMTWKSEIDSTKTNPLLKVGDSLFLNLDITPKEMTLSIFTESENLVHLVSPNVENRFYLVGKRFPDSEERFRQDIEINLSGGMVGLTRRAVDNSLSLAISVKKFDDSWLDIDRFVPLETRLQPPSTPPIYSGRDFRTKAMVQVLEGSFDGDSSTKNLVDAEGDYLLNYLFKKKLTKFYRSEMIPENFSRTYAGNGALLHQLFQDRNVDAIEFLLDNGYDPYITYVTADPNFDPAILSVGNLDSLKILLKYIDIDHVFSSSWNYYGDLKFQTPEGVEASIATTLLGFAILSGRDDAVEVLKARGASTSAMISFHFYSGKEKRVSIESYLSSSH